MNTRNRKIYITQELQDRLFWLSKLDKFKANRNDKNPIITTDEIAERIMNEKIESDYPQLKTLEKRLDALEWQLISELDSPTTDVKTP